jgi:hypothetical protein
MPCSCEYLLQYFLTGLRCVSTVLGGLLMRTRSVDSTVVGPRLTPALAVLPTPTWGMSPPLFLFTVHRFLLFPLFSFLFIFSLSCYNIVSLNSTGVWRLLVFTFFAPVLMILFFAALQVPDPCQHLRGALSVTPQLLPPPSASPLSRPSPPRHLHHFHNPSRLVITMTHHGTTWPMTLH